MPTFYNGPRMSLTTLVLLPFIGSLLAAALPTNARNTESTLAGLVAVFCAIQAALYFPDMPMAACWFSTLNGFPSWD